MFISNIVIRNFKSFKEETINLDKLNILVGSNAAGKSNTIAILRFLNYVISNGLENALSLSGGIEYVLNTTIGRKSPMFIGFSLNCEEEEWVYLANKKKNDRLLFAGIDYEFEITPHKRGDGYRITHDYLTIKYYQVTEEKKDLVLFNRNKIISVEYKRNAKGITTNFINKSDISGENDIQEEIVPTFLNRYMNDRPDFCCWLRNVDRKSWSFVIPYEQNNVWVPMYPDLIVALKDGQGFIFDILEPHDSSKDDNWCKAVGMAKYALNNPGKFGRIMLIREVPVASGGTNLKGLDMADIMVRNAVLSVTSNNALNSIFEDYAKSV